MTRRETEYVDPRILARVLVSAQRRLEAAEALRRTFERAGRS